MYYRLMSLCENLNQYRRIIIYGTGNYAHEIYPYLVERGLKNKIFCFTQSDGVKLGAIDGIPVLNEKELDCIKEDEVVLIAVSKQYDDEIKQILLDKKCQNIISLIDYRVENLELCHFDSFEEYCEFLTDWYVETRLERLNRNTVLSELLSRGKYTASNIDSNLIVMICGHISIRSNKIIGAFKRKEIDVVMLDYCKNNQVWCFNELQKINIHRERCCCIEEMLYKAMKYRPLVYFFEPRWGDCSWAEAILKNKEYFGKIVISLYDVLNDGYAGCSQSNLDKEKYALENADGIVWRWYSKDCLEKKGFQFKGKSLQFLDYCHRTNGHILETDTSLGAIRLCAVNGLGDVCVKTRTSKSRYIEYARIGEILQIIGSREDCVFHFYVGSLRKESLDQCKKYESKYKNFKFYVNVEHNELLKKLRTYDYGCDLYTDGEWASDNTVLDAGIMGSNVKNSVRNTFFDYLSEGLPIITTAPKNLVEYLEPYEVVIKMSLANIDLDYLKQHKRYYKEKVDIARKELDIDKHIVKLIDFLREV